MRWFKHMTNSRMDEKLARFTDKYGLEAYGFFWRVLEIIAASMDETDRNYAEYSMKTWCNLLGTRPQTFRKLIQESALLGLFEVSFSGVSEQFESGFRGVSDQFKKCFSDVLIKIKSHNILKLRDDWTKKKAKNSGVTPEQRIEEEYKYKVVSSLRSDTTRPHRPEGECERPDRPEESGDEIASVSPVEQPSSSRPDTQPVEPEPPDVAQASPPRSGRDVLTGDGETASIPPPDGPEEPPEPVAHDGKAGPPPCPFTALVELYHEILPELPRVKSLSKQRQSLARGRWREAWLGEKRSNRPRDQTALLEYFRRYFSLVRDCDFLMGRVKDWQADFEWLLRPSNFAKVIEDRYLNNRGNQFAPNVLETLHDYTICANDG